MVVGVYMRGSGAAGKGSPRLAFWVLRCKGGGRGASPPRGIEEATQRRCSVITEAVRTEAAKRFCNEALPTRPAAAPLLHVKHGAWMRCCGAAKRLCSAAAEWCSAAKGRWQRNEEAKQRTQPCSIPASPTCQPYVSGALRRGAGRAALLASLPPHRKSVCGCPHCVPLGYGW